MSTIINYTSKVENDFQYQLQPSAFKIAEFPTHLCWESIKSAEKLFQSDTNSIPELVKNRTIAVLYGVGGYLGGMIALPVTLCLTPITLLADIVVGVAEILFCIYHGANKEDLYVIAHRKFAISPCQHLTFCLGAIAGLGISSFFVGSFTFGGALIFWSLGYALGQKATSMLPESLNDSSFNIFIGGGSGEGDDNESWFKNTKSASASDRTKEQADTPPWEEYIQKAIPSLSRVNDANLNGKYIDFKKSLLKKCSPQELLGLADGFSKEDLQANYRLLTLILHPDKNRSREKEATALFSVLREAYNILQEPLSEREEQAS